MRIYHTVTLSVAKNGERKESRLIIYQFRATGFGLRFDIPYTSAIVDSTLESSSGSTFFDPNMIKIKGFKTDLSVTERFFG